jgi:hypothetical protein
MSRPLREKDIEDRVCDWAKANGWWVRKFASPGKRSVPDRIFIKEGRTVFIEFKRPGEEPTDAQWAEIDKIRAAGGHADWSDDIDLAKEILRGAVSVPAEGDRSHPRARV